MGLGHCGTLIVPITCPLCNKVSTDAQVLTDMIRLYVVCKHCDNKFLYVPPRKEGREAMGKYRKKPVVVEAFRFYVDAIPDWFMDKVSSNDIVLRNCNFKRFHTDDAYCEINTLEGVMIGRGGDYIIRGVSLEIYPCKKDIFEMTYEPVEVIHDASN